MAEKIDVVGKLGAVENNNGRLGMRRKFQLNGKTWNDSREFRRKKADCEKKQFFQKPSLQ
jgi:hypothetical protein